MANVCLASFIRLFLLVCFCLVYICFVSFVKYKIENNKTRKLHQQHQHSNGNNNSNSNKTTYGNEREKNENIFLNNNTVFVLMWMDIVVLWQLMMGGWKDAG